MFLLIQIYPSIRRAVVMMYQENGIRCFYRGNRLNEVLQQCVIFSVIFFFLLHTLTCKLASVHDCRFVSVETVRVKWFLV